MNDSSCVRVWNEDLVIPTYLPCPPDKNPMFLEKRVYQGSSGKVYPLPFTDRISEIKMDRRWKAIWLENRYLRVMILPELGGRIHAIQDKTNGYDLIYRQTVIKPALVGLAGPWISGGIEFNWPEHHRPATFMPVDYLFEEHDDGSKTVWCSDHDPMTRMKGMHGVCLHPEKAYVELKVRVHNRTPFVQTFLWWANAAVRVHEGYQSFFPPDVRFVADHAKRAVSEYPLCRGIYYGVNYRQRGHNGVPESERPRQFLPPHCLKESQVSDLKCPIPNYRPNDLSWYANIPTPCSYMCVGSKGDFFGGYDHLTQAGIVHIADHHISPGKKQWTWGNHEFGYAWDRNLTDADGPYIELMAGVYTDNQPDFSFLQPGETKTWSQFWYPIQKIGPAQHANLDAAVSLQVNAERIRMGVSVSSQFPDARVRLKRPDGAALKWKVNLAPGEPFVAECRQSRKKWRESDCSLHVVDCSSGEIIAYRPRLAEEPEMLRPATEPPSPQEIGSADELYFAGLHLEQYRHATRCPTLYWREALRRDPLDARCNNAMGLWHLLRGEFTQAERHFRRAVARLTQRNPNPYDGEVYYNLGLCLRYQLDSLDGAKSKISDVESPPEGSRGVFEEAYSAFYKAAWNQAGAAAGYHALAEMDCRRGDWAAGLDHLNRSLRFDAENLRARNLKVVVLRRLGEGGEADALVRQTLALDPLDSWAQHLACERLNCDLQVCLDIAHDYARAGLYAEAIELLQKLGEDGATPPLRGAGGCCEFGHQPEALPTQSWGAAPLVHYTLGWLHQQLGNTVEAEKEYRRAEAESPDYCFPHRLEEIALLEAAMRANPRDARPPYYLGNLLYDRRRHREAIRLWERSAELDAEYSVVWRNLGIGYFNVAKRPAKARRAYERAFRANPRDARLLYERDQLWKRLGDPPGKRLRELEKHSELVRQRDDLSVELCTLYNQTGQHEKARSLLSSRRFQPWEGGEGLVLGQHVRTQLALGQQALAAGDAAGAQTLFEAALRTPQNLGEARHLLANCGDIHYWLGMACAALGNAAAARRHWRAAATFSGDFQEMRVRSFSEMTFYSALSWEKLGQKARARQLFKDLLLYGRQLQRTGATIDYFATSLPAMLLFEDDIQFRQETTALFLQAEAHLGLGKERKATKLLATVLQRDPNHGLAAELLRMAGKRAGRQEPGSSRTSQPR